jgi:hypothetical protein
VELTELLAICGTAFSAVFVLLIILALVIRLITVAFPQRQLASADAAIVVAINAAVAQLVPGARVTQIKEES